MSVCLSVCMYVCLYICLSVYLSICWGGCLSILVLTICSSPFPFHPSSQVATFLSSSHTLTTLIPLHSHTLTILTLLHRHAPTSSLTHNLTPLHPHILYTLTLAPSHPHTLTPSHPHTLLSSPVQCAGVWAAAAACVAGRRGQPTGHTHFQQQLQRTQQPPAAGGQSA